MTINTDVRAIDYIPIRTDKHTLELATPEQSEAIEQIMHSYTTANSIRSYTSSSLPDGYLGFALWRGHAFDGHLIFYGRIAPDGSVST